MHYKESDETEENIIRAPDRNILHQMLVYMDYGGECKYGFVLYADKTEREQVIVAEHERKIFFLNCYPFHYTSQNAFQLVLEKVTSGL